MRQARTLLALCLALLVVGCGPSGPRPTPVKGTINLDGKPMVEGEVTFALPGAVPVKINVNGGAFSGNALTGKNRVEVRAFKPGKQVMMDKEMFGGGPENYIPTRFNTDSKLEADVTASGPNEFKFEILSK